MNPFPHLKYGCPDLRVAVLLEPWEVAMLLDGLEGADDHPELGSLRDRLAQVVQGHSKNDLDYARLEAKVAHHVDKAFGEAAS
jgi:hypothetical protein